MAYLIYGKDEILGDWAARRIRHLGSSEKFGPFKAVGVASGPTAEDKLWGVIVYHDYMPDQKTVQVSMAACNPRWATRSTIRDLLAVPFLQYVVNKVWTATPHTSERVVKFNKAIGMKREAVLRDQFGPGTHAVICGMLWKEYKKLYIPDWDDGRIAVARSIAATEASHATH